MSGKKNMHWIEEIRHDIASLKLTQTVLKKFGITMGSVAVLISFFALRQEWCAAATAVVILCIGLALVLTGLLRPALLSAVYRYWMGFAFVLGALVSRIILTLIFFLVITPISVVARRAGKRFFFTFRDTTRDTYWIDRDQKKSIHYERMS